MTQKRFQLHRIYSEDLYWQTPTEKSTQGLDYS